VADGARVHMHKSMGLVNRIFDERILHELTGHIAIATTAIRLPVPASSRTPSHRLRIQVRHHRTRSQRQPHKTPPNSCELEAVGETFESTSDTEVICRLIARSDAPTIENAIEETMHRIVGAYSLVVLTRDKLIGVRDPHGIRPLCIGRFNHKHFILSSETCALNLIGAG